MGKVILLLVPWQFVDITFLLSSSHRFIPEAWSTCSVTCGVGSQMRLVKCQVLLSFSQSVADLPIDECEGPKPVSQRACYSGPCSGEATEHTLEETQLLSGSLQELDELYDWEYEGFTECSESCGGGKGKMLLCWICFPSSSVCLARNSHRRAALLCLVRIMESFRKEIKL